MVRHVSLFSQLLTLIDRQRFYELVYRHKAHRHTKGFDSWNHFVAMLFCQLAQAKSLREICGGLACCLGKLRHLGLVKGPNKSTLSYANAHRPWQMYRDLFYETLAWTRHQMPGKHKFRFKNKLLSLDSTTISLCLSLFPWAKYRRTKGAVKLHLLLDHDGYLPTFALITDGKKSDVTVAKQLTFAKGSIIVMDRGYIDYRLFSRWTQDGVFFVTRMKDNTDYIVVEQRDIPERRNIISDDLIELAGYKAHKDCPHVLRRIVLWDAEKQQEIVFFTNHLKFGATTIAAIYKDRWQIELFFKAIKQNLKIKTFVGTSENALYIQIWTALIAMLMIKFLKFKSTFGWSLSNLVALLRWNLFTYRDLWQWIDDPFETLPQIPISAHYQLPLFDSGQHLLGKNTT